MKFWDIGIEDIDIERLKYWKFEMSNIEILRYWVIEILR